MKAKIVPMPRGWTFDVACYKLDKPVTFNDCRSIKKTNYVIVVVAEEKFSHFARGTYILPSSKTGSVLWFEDVLGRFYSDKIVSHKEALLKLGYEETNDE